jgi:hypothetical protein
MSNDTQNNNNNNKIDKKNNAIRLTFSYQGDSINLISRQSVEKLVTIPPESKSPEHISETWFELSDSKRNVIHRQNLNNLIRKDMEVFSDDPNNSISRHKVDEMKGTFSILVPDVSEADSLDIFTLPTSSAKEARISEMNKKNIFHLKLKEGRGDSQ